MQRALGVRDVLFFGVCLAALVVFAIALLRLEKQLVVPIAAELLPDGKLTAAQSTAIGMTSDLGKLMIGWSVALLGAIALSLRQAFRRKGLIRALAMLSLTTSFVAAILSVWLGMLVLDITILALSFQQDPAEYDALLDTRKWQYLCFVLALMSFVFAWITTEAYPEETGG